MRLPASLCLAMLLAACTRTPAPDAEAPRPALTHLVRFAPAGRTASFPGEVRARHETELAFRVGGKLVARLVDTGAAVSPGQVLARLDPADVELNAAAAAAQLAAAQSELRLAEAELGRARALADQGFLSRTLVETRQSVFEAARERVRQAQAQGAVARNQAAYAGLAADAAGVVTAVLAEPGQVVAAGQPVLRLARAGEREVVIGVPEARLAELRAAQRLSVSLWADPQRRYKARLRELAPAADPVSRSFAARVSVLDADERLRLGMTATVLAETAEALPQALVPATALSSREGAPVLWVVGADGAAQPRRVEVGAYLAEGVLIRSGVAEGERIVVAGVHQLAPGQKLRPLEAPATPR